MGKFSNHKIHKETKHRGVTAQKSTKSRMRLTKIPHTHKPNAKLQAEETNARIYGLICQKKNKELRN